MVVSSEISNRIRPGQFVLVVNQDGEWRIYLVRSHSHSDYLIEIDLSYKGPGTTEWRLHYGRPQEPNQCVRAAMIRGIYETVEEALEITPSLESGRLALKCARDRFHVLLSLLGNVPFGG
jgi:hypothetical protein